MMKPLSVLNQAVGKNVMVELKGRKEYRGVLDGYDPHMNVVLMVELKGRKEYRGVLDGYDPHMNVVLRNAEEYADGQLRRRLNVVIVRGDNVIYISP